RRARRARGALAQPAHPRRRPGEDVGGVRRPSRLPRRLAALARLPRRGDRLWRDGRAGRLMLRLLREPRWLGYLALAVVFALVCCFLGWWQWDRREQALAAIDRLESNYDRAPTAVADALPALDGFDIDQQWTPVLLEGEY